MKKMKNKGWSKTQSKKSKGKKRKAQAWMKLRAQLVALIHKKEGIKHVSKEMGARINALMKKAIGGTYKEKGMSYDDAMKKTLDHYKKQ